MKGTPPAVEKEAQQAGGGGTRERRLEAGVLCPRDLAAPSGASRPTSLHRPPLPMTPSSLAWTSLRLVRKDGKKTQQTATHTWRRSALNAVRRRYGPKCSSSTFPVAVNPPLAGPFLPLALMQIGYARPPALVVPSSGVLLSLGLSPTPPPFADVFKALRQRWAPLNAAAAGAVEKGPAWRGKESSEANQCSDDDSDEPAGPLKGVQDSESRTLQAPPGREGRLLGSLGSQV